MGIIRGHAAEVKGHLKRIGAGIAGAQGTNQPPDVQPKKQTSSTPSASRSNKPKHGAEHLSAFRFKKGHR